MSETCLRFEKILAKIGDSLPPLYRARVPGGWLLVFKDTMTFVPDPDHKWDGGSLLTRREAGMNLQRASILEFRPDTPGER